MEAKPQRPQNKWDLIIGLFLIGFGSYRLYQHYMLGAEYEIQIFYSAKTLKLFNVQF